MIPAFRRLFDNARDTRAAATSLQVLSVDGAGNAQVFDAYVAFTEITDPSAPSTNNARLYVRDNGAGKTQLVVRFPTGAIQVIATEP